MNYVGLQSIRMNNHQQTQPRNKEKSLFYSAPLNGQRLTGRHSGAPWGVAEWTASLSISQVELGYSVCGQLDIFWAQLRSLQCLFENNKWHTDP